MCNDQSVSPNRAIFRYEGQRITGKRCDGKYKHKNSISSGGTNIPCPKSENTFVDLAFVTETAHVGVTFSNRPSKEACKRTLVCQEDRFKRELRTLLASPSEEKFTQQIFCVCVHSHVFGDRLKLFLEDVWHGVFT